MSDTTATRAREILADLRDTLALDGYLLDVTPAEPGINIVVSAQPEACAECLVPVDVFRGIVSSYLEKGGIVGENIEVTYPAEISH